MTLEKAPALTEKLFMRQVIELAKMYRWRCYHPFLSKWSEPGFPDLTLVRGDRLIFAELKTDRGPVSEKQKEWHALLERTPVEVYVWRPRDWDWLQETLR